MKKELFLSDFSFGEKLFFRSLSKQVWSRLDLLNIMSFMGMHTLLKRDILIVQLHERTGLPCYSLRDGFMNG